VCSSDLIDDSVSKVTDYMNYLEDLTIYERKIPVFTNSKPWLTKDIRLAIKLKHDMRKAGNTDQLAITQKKLNRDIYLAKKSYHAKTIDKMLLNAKSAWQGLKRMCGKTISQPTLKDQSNSDQQLVNKLNQFYARFESTDRGPVCDNNKPALLTTDDMFGYEEVVRVLKKCKTNKACGPDGIKNIFLRSCANQLAPVLHRLYNKCAAHGHIPKIWKLANIKPLPKRPKPGELNDYRPIALTSCVMKCFEKLIAQRLRTHTNSSADPLQFAYKAKRSTTDACNILHQTVIDHAESINSYSRILFLDYSSAFNTIVPSILADRMSDIGVCEPLQRLISCFLSNREQYVTMGKHRSETRTTNTGAPQGCVLSPLLFTLYTDSLRSDFANVKILKYADDTAIIGCVTKGDESNYHHVIDKTLSWCKSNNLLLNTKKTKEMVVNYTKNTTPNLQVAATEIERVETFKYLGLVFDYKMQWSPHIEYAINKCSSRLYMFRRYATFGASRKQLSHIFSTMILSVLMYNCFVFYNACTQKDRLRCQSLVNKCNCDFNLDSLVSNKILVHCNNILKDPDHPLFDCFIMARSGRRFLLPRCKTERKRKSFIFHSLKLLNSR
jgi:hypothetical protein